MKLWSTHPTNNSRCYPGTAGSPPSSKSHTGITDYACQFQDPITKWEKAGVCLHAFPSVGQFFPFDTW